MQAECARSEVPASLQEDRAGIPLFHAAWLFALGILLAHVVWLRPPLLLIGIAALGVLSVIAIKSAPRIVWASLAILCILVGAWSAEMEPQPAPDPALLQLSDGLLRTVEGEIVSAGPARNDAEPDESGSKGQFLFQRIDLRLSSIEVVDDQTDIQQPTTGAVRLIVRWSAASGASPQAALRCGEHIRASARLLPPRAYHDPGAWSDADFLAKQGITATAPVDLADVQRLAANSPGWACGLSALQHAASVRVATLPERVQRLPRWLRLDREDAILLAAMLTGDRTGLDHPLRVAFERTGSFHMLVVSGLHLAIVAGCLLWISQQARLPRLASTVLTLAGSLAYALFTGFAAPVQRSLWMVAIYLLSRLFFRDRKPLNAIGVAALSLLAASPASLFDSSFQMTLLAVVSIAGIATPLLKTTLHPYIAATRALKTISMDVGLSPHLAQFRVALRMTAARLQPATHKRIAWSVFPWAVRNALRIAEAVTVTIIVELAMTLPMAAYFHRLTLLALPVNLLVLPVTTLLMPCALLTLLALTVWPPLAIVPASLTGLLLHAGVGMVHLFGSLSWSDVRLATPTPWQSAAFCVGLGAAVLLAWRKQAWLRRSSWIALGLAALAAVTPRPIQHPANALLFEAIDVGQGDSLLLITPEGQTLLVDTGGVEGDPRRAASAFDIGEEVVSAALWSRGIRHLDAVALSHAHADHTGGLPAIVRNFHPDELWVSPHFPPLKRLFPNLDATPAKIRTLRAGDAFAMGSLQVRVLAPQPAALPDSKSVNDESLVLQAAYGSTSVLLEGDAEGPEEQAMLTESSLQSTVLKVGHHGSTSSTIPDFLTRIAPQWAVISCGLHNRYGHPRPEILRELENARVRTVSTDLTGAVCLKLDSRSVTQEEHCSTGQSP